MAANFLDERIGQHVDKQVSINIFFFMVIYRTKAQFGFEAAKYGLQIGKHNIGAPELFCVPLCFVAIQAINARMGKQGAGDRLSAPGKAIDLCPAFINLHVNLIMLADAVMLLLKAADALPELIGAFFAA